MENSQTPNLLHSPLSADAAVFIPRFLPKSVSHDFSQPIVVDSNDLGQKLDEKSGKEEFDALEWSTVKKREIKPRKLQPQGFDRSLSVPDTFRYEKIVSSCDKKKAVDGILKGRKVLILLRGPPGSGKTSLGKALKGSNGCILSTDEYFISVDNVYTFIPEKLEDAHVWNQQRAVQAMENQNSPVIIDNTNCQAWEMKPYVRSGIRLGYDIHFLTADTAWAFDPKECARLNKHGVSYENIVNSIQRFDHNVTLRSFTHANQLKKPVRSPTKSKGNNSSTIANEESCFYKAQQTHETDFGQSASVGGSRASMHQEEMSLHSWNDVVGDLNVWSTNSGENEESVTTTVSLAADLSSALPNSADICGPKSQRPTRKNKPKSSLNFGNLASAAWLLPTDLVGGLQQQSKEEEFLYVDGQNSGIQSMNRSYEEEKPSYVDVSDKCIQVNEKIIALTTCLRRSSSKCPDEEFLVTECCSPVYSKLKLSGSHLLCDKGAQTDAVAAPFSPTDIRTKCEMVKACFPTVAVDDLTHILNYCEGDVEWASNVLLDSGHGIDWNIYEVDRILENQQTSSANKEEESAEADDSFTSSSNAADSETNAKNEEGCGISAADEWSSGFHTIELSVSAAMQLQQVFGRLHDDLPAELLSPRQLKVKLPFEVFAQLYQCWLDTQASKKRVDDGFNEGGFDDDEDYYFDDFTSNSDSFIDGMTIDQQMMLDEQIARQLLEDEMQRCGAPAVVNPDSLASKINFKKLREMFPGVDGVVLNELFSQNGYRFEPTVEMICQSYNISSTRKPIVVSESKVYSSMSHTHKRATPKITETEDFSDMSYEALRREAFKYMNMRKECFEKAQDMFRRNMKPVASYYAQLGRQHDLKFKNANHMAAQKLMDYRKSHGPSDTLDLHGLHVAEAISALAEHIRENSHRRGKVLKIITGQGKHSGRGPKIKPAVVSFLNQRSIQYSEAGSGLIQIKIT